MPARSFSLHCTEALLPQGWVRDLRIEVAQGRICALSEGAPPQPQDERHAAVLPGLPNLHSHGFQRAMAGLAEVRGPGRDSFWSWREAMYRFLERLGPDDVAAITAQAYLEMLEAGFTRVGEFHYLHHDPAGTAYGDCGAMVAAIAEAAGETGIGLTLLPVFYAHGGFGGLPPEPQQRRFIHGLDSYRRLHERAGAILAALPDARLGVAAHSLRAVTGAQLADLAVLAGSGPMHIHIAEQQREVTDCLAWSGLRPVEWLLDHADLSARWCLVHATHLTDAECSRLAASGAVVGLCPVTEANLGDGLFPAGPFLAAGGSVGIGTDSNVLICAAEEMRLLEYGQRLAQQGRNLLAAAPGESSGGSILRAVLAGGAQALGAQAGLVLGNSADFISLRTDHPALLARRQDALLDSWIFAARGNPVDCVWRGGVKLVEGGRHGARAQVFGRYRAVLQRLLA